MSICGGLTEEVRAGMSGAALPRGPRSTSLTRCAFGVATFGIPFCLLPGTIILKTLLWIVLGLVVAFSILITYLEMHVDEYTAEEQAQQQRQLSQRLAQQRDTASLPTLCRLIRQEYRRQDFGQATHDIRLVLARHPDAPEARELPALLARMDSLTTGAGQRQARKQQRRARATSQKFNSELDY
jgi:hypothetical protein